jgi:hypothetical protein
VCGATNTVPQWWDLAIVAGFSLLVYYWALAVRLPDEQARGYIGDVNAQIGAVAETVQEPASAPAQPAGATPPPVEPA